MVLERGIYAAVLTPLKKDLSCDVEKLVQHSLGLIEKGCQGVALFGTTGEGPSFSTRERIDVLLRAVALGLDPKKILFGNAASSIDDTVEAAKAVCSVGCAALLAAPPCFYKNVKEEGVVSFYREIIRRSGDGRLKVILYHIPQFSGVPMTIPIIEKLVSEFSETIVGLKESEGNLPLAKAAIERFKNLMIYVGSEKMIVDAVRAGGAGSICGLANLYPELICSLLQKEVNPPEIDQIFQGLKGLDFIPALKAELRWHDVRPPLVKMP
ncbi:MAG: dihydrodipicolinate synthase family protein [Verrucomicrobia bacterium]|nr:dihydrodipicolinate synthase family protein [Verrucomicrobiota bacterium]